MKLFRSVAGRLGRGTEMLALLLTVGTLVLAFVAAILGWPVATVILLAVSVAGEWFLPRDAAKSALLLHQASFGVPMRFAIRVVTALLITGSFDALSSVRVFVIGAVVYALLLAALALHTEYYFVGPLQHMETRNTPGGTHIPTAPPAHHLLLVASQLLVVVPAPAGAVWYLVLALSFLAAASIVAVTVPEVRRTWRMRQQKRATGFTGPLRQVQNFIDDYSPEVVVHLSGSETAGYQIDMWLETLEGIDQRVLIIVRDHELFTRMAATTIPVIELASGAELMMLNFDCVRIALYPSNTGNNIHLLRLPSMMSAFIGHGDSDKTASNNPFSRVYDELWVAGEAGADRYRRSGLGIHESQFRRVGRPQADAISRSPRLGGADVPALLYAPTWEGVNQEQEYSSLSKAGVAVVRAALESPRPVRVIYKPHPFTGQRDAKYRAVHASIVAMIKKANTDTGMGHLVVGSKPGDPDLIDCFNMSTALVGDISSVISDYLASEKPYAVVNHDGQPDPEFTATYPSAGAAAIIGRDGSGIDRFVKIVTSQRADEQSVARSKLAHYLLGPPEDRSVEGFQQAITAFIARSESERAQYR